jgi:hypothetical protein
VSGQNNNGHTLLLCLVSGYGILNFTLAMAGWVFWYWLCLFWWKLPVYELPLKWPLCGLFCMFQLSAFVSALAMSIHGVPGREKVVITCLILSAAVFLAETTFSQPEMYVDSIDGSSAAIWTNWICTGGYEMTARTRFIGAGAAVASVTAGVLISKRRLAATRRKNPTTCLPSKDSDTGGGAQG